MFSVPPFDVPTFAGLYAQGFKQISQMHSRQTGENGVGQANPLSRAKADRTKAARFSGLNTRRRVFYYHALVMSKTQLLGRM